jgi:hypothetical protein
LENAVERSVKELGAIDYVTQVLCAGYEKSKATDMYYSAGAAGNPLAPICGHSSFSNCWDDSGREVARHSSC